MRRVAAAVSPLAVAFAAAGLFGVTALAACAKDAADTSNDDAGGSTVPDAWTVYDTSVPRYDANLPPDYDAYIPPDDTGPPPPPNCNGIGSPCLVANGGGDCPPAFPPAQCLEATFPVDAGADAGDAGDAGPLLDGVCVSAFDFIGCTGNKCVGGGRCLLAAKKCLGAGEVACVCGDGGAGSPCGP